MAERGHGTAGLPRNASEAQVRQALAWAAAGWPWAHYGPVVMAAVRAGVPVVGANLPRAQMRAAMQDSTLDARLPAPQLAEQEERIRTGHCNALPAQPDPPHDARADCARPGDGRHGGGGATAGPRAAGGRHRARRARAGRAGASSCSFSRR